MVDKSEKFNWLVRVGYFSRAILYTVLGLIALTSIGEMSDGTDGIFKVIRNFPAGVAILWVMVVGLLAYAAFRFCSPLFDIENEGGDAIGWGKRIGHAGSAIGHLALAWSAYKLAATGGSSGGGAQQAASGLLTFEIGGTLIGILGLTFFIAAFNQGKKGVTGSFMNRISEGAPSATKVLGHAGYIARAVVFAVIGWSLVQTGFLSSGSENVKTLGEALGSLSSMGIVFTLVAIGLLMFGLFSFVLARYRIIPELDSRAGIPKFRA
ncbi:DUF1206 domain-containing protein [Sphingomonadaceae bacterium]|nr:DUF1206 domain-containing protein [Sphingomonadaceae bacterium]